jgi:amidase
MGIACSRSRRDSPKYLAAAYASGSSNGSGVAVGASMGWFGLGEETVSSGRSPASNNGLSCWTPSRGLLSLRGNWPLFPLCDTCVPHTRTMTDLFHLLDNICKYDKDVSGDFWREQEVIALPKPEDVRPDTFLSLAKKDALRGKRFAVPKQYINKDQSTGIIVRPSIVALWEKAAADLKSAGAELVETNFPLVEEYEKDGLRGKPPYYTDEWQELDRYAFFGLGLDRFLRLNGQADCNKLVDVDPSTLFPPPPGSLPDRDFGAQYDYHKVVDSTRKFSAFTDLPGYAVCLPHSSLSPPMTFSRTS